MRDRNYIARAGTKRDRFHHKCDKHILIRTDKLQGQLHELQGGEGLSRSELLSISLPKMQKSFYKGKFLNFSNLLEHFISTLDPSFSPKCPILAEKNAKMALGMAHFASFSQFWSRYIIACPLNRWISNSCKWKHPYRAFSDPNDGQNVQISSNILKIAKKISKNY